MAALAIFYNTGNVKVSLLSINLFPCHSFVVFFFLFFFFTQNLITPIVFELEKNNYLEESFCVINR